MDSNPTYGHQAGAYYDYPSRPEYAARGNPVYGQNISDAESTNYEGGTKYIVTRNNPVYGSDVDYDYIPTRKNPVYSSSVETDYEPSGYAKAGDGAYEDRSNSYYPKVEEQNEETHT